MKEGYTRKLYWGKWSHKLVMSLGRTDDSKLDTLTKYKKDRTALLRWMKSNGHEYKTMETYRVVDLHEDTQMGYYDRYRYNYVKDHTLTLYFKDAQLLKSVLGHHTYGPRVSYVEKPFSEGHLEALEVEKMVVRRTLWWDKYRYAARLKPQPRNTSWPRKPCEIEAGIRKWIDDQLYQACGRLEDVDYKFTSSGYYKNTMHFYFAHAQDAMMFRLAFGEHVKHNERIKLMSELKDAPSEATLAPDS